MTASRASLDLSYLTVFFLIIFLPSSQGLACLGRDNKPGIQQVFLIVYKGFPGIVAKLRKLSPYWDQKKDAPRSDADTLFQQAR